MSTQLPRYVKILAEILDCELVSEPFMVRTLKTFLKAASGIGQHLQPVSPTHSMPWATCKQAFSQMYHDGELDSQEATGSYGILVLGFD